MNQLRFQVLGRRIKQGTHLLGGIFCIHCIEMLPLSAFIHRNFVVLNHKTPVSQANRAICENQIGCLLIGDEAGNAVGIVTDRDIVCRETMKSVNQEASMEQIMSHDLITADEGDSVSDVLQLMERNGIRRVPIIHKKSDGKKSFSGIITLDDLIAANQVDPAQLSRIIRRQVGRRMAFLKELHSHAQRRSQIRSVAHKEETLHKFYSHLSKYIQLEPDILPGVTQFILGVLVMRVTYTSAMHFLAQFPQWIQEILLRLPPGPDKSYSGRKLIQELCQRFHFSEEKACAIFSRFLVGLNDWMGPDVLDKLKVQLPTEYHPFFESAAQESLKRTKEIQQSHPGLSKNEKLQGPSLALADCDPPPAWASSFSFSSRTQAAELVAKKLSRYRGKDPLVLGIPRGSVPMAKLIADELGGDLDVVLVHKIGAPDNPEYAIGSVSEFGTIYRSEAVEFYEIPEEYIEKTASKELARLKQRRLSYSPVRPPINPKGRVVIIVDDGIATGSTMLAAIRAIRSQNPHKVVVAAPVASPRTLDLLKPEVDELVILETPELFFSISQFYDDFPQVDDEEVLQILTDVGVKGKHRQTASSRKKTA